MTREEILAGESKYGLGEPEFIDMEIALRINLYRAVVMPQGGGEKVPDKAEKNAGEHPKVPERVKKSAGEYRKVPDGVKKSAGEYPKVPENGGKSVREYRSVLENSPKVSENTGVYRKSFGGCHVDTGQLSRQQVLIYQEIVLNGQITSAKVEALLGVRERRARVILKNMTEKGIIRKIGAAQATKYVLNEAEEYFMAKTPETH